MNCKDIGIRKSEFVARTPFADKVRRLKTLKLLRESSSSFNRIKKNFSHSDLIFNVSLVIIRIEITGN